MQYKTIILELIQQNETLHNRLRRERNLLATVERIALELKAGHETWLHRMAATRPDEGAVQVYYRAFEMALMEMEERLLPGSQATEDATLSPHEIMSLVAACSPKK